MNQNQPTSFVPFNVEAARAAAAAAPADTKQNPVFPEGQYLVTITNVTYGPGYNEPTSKQMQVHMTIPQSSAPGAPVREQTDFITLEGGKPYALKASHERFLELGDLFGALTPNGMNTQALIGKQAVVTLEYKVKDKGPTNYVKSWHPAPQLPQPQPQQHPGNPAGLPPAPAPYTPPAATPPAYPAYPAWGGQPPAPAAPPAQAPYPGGDQPPPPPPHVFTPPPSDGDF